MEPQDPLAELVPDRDRRAHVSLRRLSAIALSAAGDADVLGALEREAQSALAADVVRILPHGDATAGAVVPDAGHELALPLAWAGAVRHVVMLTRREPATWTSDEVAIGETLVNQAALALARLEGEERHLAQTRRDRALTRAARALNVSLELREILDTLAREAGLSVGGDVAGVYLRDADGSGVATAGYNCPADWFGCHLEPGTGIAGQVLLEGRTVNSSVLSGTVTPPHAALGNLCAGVGVPMSWNGQLRGAVSVGFFDNRDVSREDVQVLEAIADLAMVACNNAEVHAGVRTAASTDALTGLLNHGAMQVRVREEIARAVRDRQPLCCVLIDLDDFKRVNDDFGHPAGDELLRRVADALRAEVRPYDQVARYGGDEFVIVLPATEERVARTIAERVRDRIGADAPYGAGDCSIGLAAWEPSMSADDLLAAADRVLLFAKRTGKGRVAVASLDAEEELTRLEQSDASPAAVQALAAAIDSRDSHAQGHAEEVVRLATGVALLLGLPADAVKRIEHAALLHDVGKLAVPPEILGKAGVLDDAEWNVMAEHPVIGERILKRIPQLAAIAPIVRHEHEHWDGAGYPDALAGSAIPVGSRIIHACDAYAAMTAPRPYRAALTQADALGELRHRSGTQFDPQVVVALLDVLGGGTAWFQGSASRARAASRA